MGEGRSRRVPGPRRAWAAVVAAGVTAIATAGGTLAATAQGTEGGAGANVTPLFETSSQCMACHQGMFTPGGEDVSIGTHWRASMMANAARDPYWQAAVRREVLEHGSHATEIQAECSTCHMPMASYEARTAGAGGKVFVHLPASRAPGLAPARSDRLAMDGVSCTACHQIRPDGLGTRESFVGGFAVDETTPMGAREVFGPFAVDSGRERLMHSASGFVPSEADHVASSELCATCHTLYTTALDESGTAAGELPEQVPYLEWRHSGYRDERGCVSCHMPVVRDSVAVTGVLGQPRAEVNRHVFRGGNFFALRMLARYGGELGVTAPAADLEAAARSTVHHLQQRAARLDIEGVAVQDGVLEATVTVENLAGHKLPTAYPSRRAWLHLTVRDRSGKVVFESGAFRPDGSIAGNDNDADASRYEPHYREIRSPDEVQVYEAIMVDPDVRVTTGLLRAVRFVKDNRVLPAGFEKATADADIAVQGAAADDDDFTEAGDRTRYRVDVGASEGPYRLVAELWYQPVAHRWAMNLADHDAAETDRFVRWYREMAASSAVVLARASAATR